MSTPAHTHTGTVATSRPWVGGMVARLLLTIGGAGAMAIGSLMDWIRTIEGTELDIRALIRPEFGAQSDVIRTVGFVIIGLAVIAVLGLAPRGGWLTGLAAALAIATIVAVGIELYRDAGQDFARLPEAGAWVALGGAVAAFVGSLVGARPKVVVEEEVSRSDVVHHDVASHDPAHHEVTH